MNFLKKNADALKISFILIYIFTAMSFFVMTQPFGDGPDEIDRYKIVSFIERHGTLPLGDDSEVLIGGYGASYAFQPISTYMISGYLLRLLTPLMLSDSAKLIIARYVNVLFGLIAAYFTFRISKLLFKDKDIAFLFAAAVTLLPQNIFIYTYVNTDGIGLMSIAIIIYGILRGYRTDFDIKSVVALALGISFCLLSYYNCYGYVLVAFIAFVVYFIRKKDYKSMFKKGIPIAVTVLCLAGWWFIRNGILYNGDIFALNARRECAQRTGEPEWLYIMSQTYHATGHSLYEMLFKSDYITLVWRSFVAMFGPMTIPTSRYVYWVYAGLFFVSIIGLFIPFKPTFLDSFDKKKGLLIRFYLVISAIIPAALAIFYSYEWDYQPQGRYYLPCLIPFFALLSTGMEKLILFAGNSAKKITKKEDADFKIKSMSVFILCLVFLISVAVSVVRILTHYGVL
ncbi:MAG: hypothetical protein J6033_01450 [Lachnospiraceae bacterium]|nr:hypothetical protein [Lachnospiraceae bacterium]